MKDTTSLPGDAAAGQIPAPDRTTRIAVSQVLVVVVHTGHEKTRRRVFLSLKSAERAVRRAHVAGYDAQIVLARLVPEPGPAIWQGGDA